MHEYIVAENPDSRLIKRACSMLNDDKLIIIPTDTSWSIVCSVKSKNGISKLEKMTPKGKDRPLTLMCNSISGVSELCELSSSAFKLMKKMCPGPYVFVVPSTNKAAKSFDLRRAEIGVRIPNHKVPLALIEELGCALLSITAKKTLLGQSTEDLAFPEEILFSGGWELEDIPDIDLILDPGETNERAQSTVLDLRNDEVEVLRMGIGPYSI